MLSDTGNRVKINIVSQIRKNATMTVKYWKKLKNGLLTLGKDLSQRRVELIHFRLGRSFSPLRTLNVTTCNYLTQTTQAAQQCFGSGIRCLFDHLDLGSAFQNRVFLDLGSHIPNPYFWELCDNYFCKSYTIIGKLANKFFQYFKIKIIFTFVNFVAPKQFFFNTLFCCSFWIRDPGSEIPDLGWVKIMISDPG